MATDIVEADAWTSTVQVPEPGDDRDAASVEVGFQALTNRTKYLRESAGVDAVFRAQPCDWTGQHTFSQSINFDAPKTLHRVVPLQRGVVFEDGTARLEASTLLGVVPRWYLEPGHLVVTVLFEIDTPTGFVVSDLRAGVTLASGQSMQLVLVGQEIDGVNGDLGTYVVMRDGASVASVGDQVVTAPVAGGANQTLTRNDWTYSAALLFTNPGGAAARINWLRFSAEAPGYRVG